MVLASLLISHSPPSPACACCLLRNLFWSIQFLRRCFTIYRVPHLDWWFSLHIGPFFSSISPWPANYAPAGVRRRATILSRGVDSIVIAHSIAAALLLAPRWVTRNCRILEPGLEPKSCRSDMVFQTRPSCWTEVPRLRSRERESYVTGSNRWTLYRTPLSCQLSSVCPLSLPWRFIHFGLAYNHSV